MKLHFSSFRSFLVGTSFPTSSIHINKWRTQCSIGTIHKNESCNDNN